MEKESLSKQILDSIDDNLIKDNSDSIKAEFTKLSIAKKKKKTGFKWGFLGTSLAAVTCAAIAIPLTLNKTQPNDTKPSLENIPTVLNKQVSDISFGIASLSNVVTVNAGEQTQSIAKKMLKNSGYGDPGAGDPGSGGPGNEQTYDYLPSLEEMYALAEPYLPTVDAILNGASFEIPVTLSGIEEYPYQLGTFIFNIIEDETQLGEVDEEEEGELEDEHRYSYVESFYYIEGLLYLNNEILEVTGEQTTYLFTTDKGQESFSELYLNVMLSETTGITVYKSTLNGSFTNTFKEKTSSIEYSEQTYAYVEFELVTEELPGGKEHTKQKVKNAIELDISSDTKSMEEKEDKKDAEIYLSIESSFTQDEVENTISADICFRLPKEEHGYGPGPRFYRDEKEEDETKQRAFRVDYDCQIIQNHPFDEDDQYGHGQHGHDDWGYGPGPGDRHHDHPGTECITIYGTFYVYKDADGNLLTPDFETEGHHFVSYNGYHWGWFDNWDW